MLSTSNTRAFNSFYRRVINRTSLTLSLTSKQTLKNWRQARAATTRATMALMGVVVMSVGLISVAVTMMKAMKVCNILLLHFGDVLTNLIQ